MHCKVAACIRTSSCLSSYQRKIQTTLLNHGGVCLRRIRRCSFPFGLCAYSSSCFPKVMGSPPDQFLDELTPTVPSRIYFCCELYFFCRVYLRGQEAETTHLSSRTIPSKLNDGQKMIKLGSSRGCPPPLKSLGLDIHIQYPSYALVLGVRDLLQE